MRTTTTLFALTIGRGQVVGFVNDFTADNIDRLQERTLEARGVNSKQVGNIFEQIAALLREMGLVALALKEKGGFSFLYSKNIITESCVCPSEQKAPTLAVNWRLPR